MKIRTAVGAALLATMIGAMPAKASTYIGTPENKVSASLVAKPSQRRVAPVKVARRVKANTTFTQDIFAVEYGDTLPPVGFVNFCASNKAECQDYSWGEKLSPQKLKMSRDRWTQIYQINTAVNARVKPVSDQALYGKAELWTYPKNAGDCEDYALLKKRLLQKLGVPARVLQMTVVLDEHNEGHAVLTIAADSGDYVLDNRRDDVLLWNDTNYTFLKRQSVWNPRHWVALLNKSSAATRVASSQSR